MAKYKVGDKVRVISNGVPKKYYYMDDGETHNNMVEEMLALCGKVVTISKITPSGQYNVKECDIFGWTDEMFVGLADEQKDTPTNKYKVGDKVKIIGANIKNKEKYIGKVVTIRQLNPNGSKHYENFPYGVEESGCDLYIWFENELELVGNEPAPEPIQVNVNVTVNISYENSCWYCRKGGLVDRYFAGKPGICPNCGRVCNAVTHSTQCYKPVDPFKKEEKKENKPLTTEELKALPDGTRVFTVWQGNWNSKKTRWRIKCGAELRWETGTNWCGIDSPNIAAYLEEPERPI